MFDVGFWELALIFVVALVVVGPERMPGLIRTTGQWLGRMQRVARELRAEFEREAHTQEFKALNAEFLAEDRRLKELARMPVGAPTSREAALEQASAAENTTTEATPPNDAPHALDAAVPSAARTTTDVAASKADNSA